MGGAFDVEVRSLMRPGVVSVGEHATVEQARRAMLAHKVHAVLVIGDGGHAVGWVTAGGALAHMERSADLTPAGAAIDEPAVGVHPNEPASRAVELLREHDVQRLYVARAEGEHPEGVIGELDLLGA
ncbi:MAG: CBS domain-containing protein [Solirubrobacterales bacterium]